MGRGSEPRFVRDILSAEIRLFVLNRFSVSKVIDLSILILVLLNSHLIGAMQVTFSKICVCLEYSAGKLPDV